MNAISKRLACIAAVSKDSPIKIRFLKGDRYIRIELQSVRVMVNPYVIFCTALLSQRVLLYSSYLLQKVGIMGNQQHSAGIAGQNFNDMLAHPPIHIVSYLIQNQ